MCDGEGDEYKHRPSKWLGLWRFFGLVFSGFTMRNGH